MAIELDTDGLEFPFWLLPLALAPVALARRGAAQTETPGPVTTAAMPAVTLPAAPLPDAMPVTGPVSEPVTQSPQQAYPAQPAPSTTPEVRAAVQAAVQKIAEPARAKIAEAQTQATFDIHNVLQKQASEIRKQVSAPLIRAGVHPSVIEQRVKTALVPVENARKAIETVSKTGTVAPAAREALLRAQAVYPDLKKRLAQAAAPVRQARAEAQRGAERVRRDVTRAAQSPRAPAVQPPPSASTAASALRRAAAAPPRAPAAPPRGKSAWGLPAPTPPRAPSSTAVSQGTVQELERQKAAAIKKACAKLPSLMRQPCIDAINKKTRDEVRKATKALAPSEAQSAGACPQGRAGDACRDAVKKQFAAARYALEHPYEVTRDAIGEGIAKLAKDIPGTPAEKQVALLALDALAHGRVDAKTLQSLGGKVGKQLLEQYGKKIGEPALRSVLKVIPDLHIPASGAVSAIVTSVASQLLSGKFTPEKLLKAGVGAAVGVLEEALQKQILIPIHLPRDLNAKELLKTFTGLIPKNIEGVIDVALGAATTVASTAAAAAIGGAIGSAIPGLGTVIGIGVAIGIGALKNLIKGGPPPYKTLCPSEYSLPWPVIPQGMSAIDLLPWSSHLLLTFTERIKKQQKEKPCRLGKNIRAAEFLFKTLQRAGETIEHTPSQLGPEQVRALISAYERAPRRLAQADWFNNPLHEELKGPGDRMRGYLDGTLAKLKQRRTQLDTLKSQIAKIPTMPPGRDKFGNQIIDSLNAEIYRELQAALVQYVNTGGSQGTKAWVAELKRALEASAKRVGVVKTITDKPKADAHARREQLAKDPNWKPKQYTVS